MESTFNYTIDSCISMHQTPRVFHILMKAQLMHKTLTL